MCDLTASRYVLDSLKTHLARQLKIACRQLCRWSSTFRTFRRALLCGCVPLTSSEVRAEIVCKSGLSMDTAQAEVYACCCRTRTCPSWHRSTHLVTSSYGIAHLHVVTRDYLNPRWMLRVVPHAGYFKCRVPTMRQCGQPAPRCSWYCVGVASSCLYVAAALLLPLYNGS